MFAYKSLIGLFGIILIQIPVTAQIQNAKIFPPYRSPADTRSDRSSQRRTISGSRGCPNQSAQLTLLVPSDHVATTVSAHPTFLFYLSKIPSHPIRISVVEPQTAALLFDKTMTVRHSGVFAFSLPQSSPALENEKTYILTVGILCNPARMSASAYTSIALQKISPTESLRQQLTNANTALDRARIYIKNGIWYDGVASSFQASQLGISQATRYFQSLIAQIDLSFSQIPISTIPRTNFKK